jgi:hypothetical protein
MKMLSSALLVLISASAFANGSGYNGPDLQGTSIPTAVDRAIQIKDIVRVTNECAKILATDVYAKIFKRDFKVGQTGKVVGVSLTEAQALSVAEDEDPGSLNGIKINYSAHRIEVFPFLELVDSEGCKLGLSTDFDATLNLTIDVTHCAGLANSSSRFFKIVGYWAGNLTITDGLPMENYSFQIIATDQVYDAYGNLVSQSHSATNLILGEQFDEEKPAVESADIYTELLNADTHQDLGVKAPTGAYNLCMKSELQ